MGIFSFITGSDHPYWKGFSLRKYIFDKDYHDLVKPGLERQAEKERAELKAKRHEFWHGIPQPSEEQKKENLEEYEHRQEELRRANPIKYMPQDEVVMRP